MSAKQSSEVRHALMLCAKGVPVYEASRIAGVYASTVYRAIKKKLKKRIDKRVA